MAGRLENKVCIITGSGGSMGRAASVLFAKEGARVVGCDINEGSASATLAQVCGAGGEMVSLHPCNLTDRGSGAASQSAADRLVEFALDTYGQVDVLFNNAAMAYFGWIEEMPDEDWYKTINEELNIVFHLTRAAWPALKERGGSIINTASTSAWLSTKVLPGIAHTAAKGGVLSMTRQLAMEGAPHGIRANTISPGLIETNQTKDFLQKPEWAGPMLDKIMLNRLGKPEEVAYAAVFLASDESSFVTGSDLKVDGGFTAW